MHHRLYVLAIIFLCFGVVSSSSEVSESGETELNIENHGMLTEPGGDRLASRTDASRASDRVSRRQSVKKGLFGLGSILSTRSISAKIETGPVISDNCRTIGRAEELKPIVIRRVPQEILTSWNDLGVKYERSPLQSAYMPMTVKHQCRKLSGLSQQQKEFVSQTFQDGLIAISKALKVKQPMIADPKFGDLNVVVQTTEKDIIGIMHASIIVRESETYRPQLGRVLIDPHQFNFVWRRRLGKKTLRVVILHELLHILGFSSDNIPFFINRDTLERKYFKPENFRCYRLESSPSVKLDWDVDCESEGARYHWAGESTFEAPSSEECKGAPIDPSIQYSEKEVERFLKNKSLCPIRVILPKVAEKVRNMFPDATEPGLQFQVMPGTDDWGLVSGGHWDDSRSKDDVMVSELSEASSSFLVHPYTLAFLEESGWYEVDYSVLDPGGPFEIFLKGNDK